MDFYEAMAISTSGMRTQGVRMKVVSENIANANTTGATPEEDPYRRKTITFKNVLDRQTGIEKVEVNEIEEDQSDFILSYEPNHPAANEEGYIKRPNVNTILETMDMKEAQKSYEANLGTMQISRQMLMRTIDAIGGR